MTQTSGTFPGLYKGEKKSTPKKGGKKSSKPGHPHSNLGKYLHPKKGR